MKRAGFLTAAMMFVICGQAAAEDVTGSEQILCAGVQAVYCDTSGECEIGMPWHWNMPQFVVIDFEEKIVRTTSAADRPRQTPIRTLERSGGEIYLQGVENGRAFSFVIDEATGVASIAIAVDQMTISVFAACTPMAAGE